MESWLVIKQAELLQIRCNVEAMIAENAQRAYSGEAPSYVEADFYGCTAECESIISVLHQHG